MNQLSNDFVNQIRNCDAIVGMKRLPDECIPLTLTSPPYDDLRHFGGYKWDFEVFRQMADALLRITVSGGVVVWIVADTIVDGSETCTSARQKLYFREIGFNVHHTMIMDRAGSRFPSKVRYGSSLEYAFILSKGAPRTTNLLRDRPNKLAGKPGVFNRRERMPETRRDFPTNRQDRLPQGDLEIWHGLEQHHDGFLCVRPSRPDARKNDRCPHRLLVPSL